MTGDPVNGVYKLVQIGDRPTMKKSSGKATYPGCKQIFRNLEAGRDRLGLATEAAQSGEMALLEKVMAQGKRLTLPEDLATIRQRTTASVRQLPDRVKRLTQPEVYPVSISESLQTLTEAIAQSL